MKSKLVPIGLALTLASVARADFAPIALTPSSYNADVVVENTVPALGNNTSATTDQGTNNTGNGWYEIGYNANSPASGLPAAGSTFVSASFTNHSYTMAPSYTTNNAWLIDTGVTNATITLVTPAAYTNLSFLITSGNGGGTVAYKIHHADATTESGTFICSDWFGGVNPAFISFGRVNVISGNFDTQGSITSPGNPRLYGRDVTVVNTASPITSIDLAYSSGAANVHNQVYALSGATAAGPTWSPIAVTGHTYDLVVEAGGVHRGPTGATTQSMDNDVNGVNAWYEKGYHKFLLYANTGLPVAGSTITNASATDHAYKFAPDYTQNNVAYLNPTNAIVTQTLVTPTAYSALSFLNSSGNGPRNIDVLINHADGSSETHTFVSLDWFNGAASVLGTSGRVEVDTKQFNNLTATPNSNPKLFAAEFILNNTVSPITNIVLSSTNLGGRTAIFAVSGTAGAAAPIFSLQPQPLILSPGLIANFTASVSGTAPLTLQWQKGTNGIYVNVVNGGTISGAATTNLTITGVVAGDDAD
ncbi:MAG: hypothetical protein JWR69_2318, partial [Pedosphaera sp.]|nr:hypothetical protein [Pedosphaera sp.]